MRTRAKKSNFDIFKSEFLVWQKRFGLNGYKIYFKCVSLDDCFAQIEVNQQDMVATVAWTNTFTSEYDRSQANPKQSAKHEALHLLIYRLEDLAYRRFINKESVVETAEELVRRLEEITK